MNKKEWKDQYSAARMLIKARFPNGYRTDSKEARQIVWDVTYNYILNNMHPSIGEAVFHSDGWYHLPITDKICIKINITKFNRRMPRRESKMKWGNKQ